MLQMVLQSYFLFQYILLYDQKLIILIYSTFLLVESNWLSHLSQIIQSQEWHPPCVCNANSLNTMPCGNIRKWHDIAQFSFCSPVALQSENNATQKKAENRCDNVITEPDPKEPTKHHGSDTLGVAPALHDIKASCPGPQIAKQPLCFEKNTIFTQICEACRSLNSDTLGRQAGSCLNLPTPVSRSLHLH